LVARQLLRRTGVVFRRLLVRERAPVSWSSLVRVYRRMELRGEVRGGRFVAGFTGEQFALPEAVQKMRELRRQTAAAAGDAPSETQALLWQKYRATIADPLYYDELLVPESRPLATSSPRALVG
jgi:ATP-dependent Lhr-like helicase